MRKLAVIAVTGLSVCVLCLGAAAVIEAPHWRDGSWKNFHLDFDGLDDCETVAGATATTRLLDWDGDDDKVTIAVPADVRYRPGDSDKLSASGDAQALAHLRVRHHHIELDCNGGLSGAKLQITLPGRKFHSFTIAGSGKLNLEQIDQGSLKVTIAGSGTATAAGKVDDVEVEIAGSGDAKLGQLAARTASVKIAGSGDAEVAPSEAVKIKIAGSGDVRLLSDPKDIDSKVFGSGRILHGPGAAKDEKDD